MEPMLEEVVSAPTPLDVMEGCRCVRAAPSLWPPPPPRQVRPPRPAGEGVRAAAALCAMSMLDSLNR